MWPAPSPVEWVRGLDAHPGLSGKHLAALPCLPVGAGYVMGDKVFQMLGMA